MIQAIDSHAHIFTRELPLAPVRRHAPTHDATVDDYLALLDAHGISHGVLVQPSFLGTDNSYLLDALRRHPTRLRGVVVVEPRSPPETLLAMAGQGVVGIRLNLVGLPIPDFTADAWPRLLGEVSALGWQVEVQRAAGDLHRIVPPLVDSGCTVVVDHFGRPDEPLGLHDPGFEALLGMARTKRVWVKLSAAYRSWPDTGPRSACAAAQALLEAFGPSHLVWGSDWPHAQHTHLVDYTRARDALDAWVPDAAQRRTILAETPARLFGFSAAT